MAEAPEGQVPRDAAFWATYRAVRAEEMAREAEQWRRTECLRNGHEMSRSMQRCRNCGLAEADVFRATGAVREGDRWVWRGEAATLVAPLQITWVP